MSINPDRILYRDDHFLAVHKLSGELVVKGSGKVEKLPLLDFLRREEPGLRPLNRLDFETSGVVLFARTKEAFAAALFSRKGKDEDVAWTKIYRMLVMGRVRKDRDEIIFPLPARSDGTKVPALTRFHVLERFANSSYVEAAIETGRHHQIRRHFAEIGHPLVLDHVYGHVKFNRTFTQEFRLHHFFLHALRLEFKHPITGEEVRIEAPLPRAFGDILTRLRKLA